MRWEFPPKIYSLFLELGEENMLETYQKEMELNLLEQLGYWWCSL